MRHRMLAAVDTSSLAQRWRGVARLCTTNHLALSRWHCATNRALAISFGVPTCFNEYKNRSPMTFSYAGTPVVEMTWNAQRSRTPATSSSAA